MSSSSSLASSSTSAATSQSASGDSAAAKSNPNWFHPHQSCGAYHGPLDPLKAPPSLCASHSHLVVPAESLTYSKDYPASVKSIIDGIATHAKGYEKLEHLCTEFGARISGSDVLERAIDWAEKQMKDEGLENVHTEPVMVPNWVRGEARCEISVFPSASLEAATVPERRIRLNVLSIGLSVGTVPLAEAQALAARARETDKSSAAFSGTSNVCSSASSLASDIPAAHVVTAPVIVVSSFDELDALVAKDADAVRGKVVLFNFRYTNYGLTVPYRALGAQRAQAVGAVAAIVRSITPISLYTPHTGGMAASIIPVVCCTIEDAELLSKLSSRGKHLRVALYSSAHRNPDKLSRNVVAEIKGREKPEEVVVIGAHIDSWDVGSGAHDDGQGCMVAWEVVRILLKLGLRPRRTVRCVLFTDEEVQSSGGAAYLKAHQGELQNMQACMETDLGAYFAEGFGFTGCDEAKVIITELMKLLTPYKADKISQAGPGVDVRPLSDAGVPSLLLWFPPEWTYTEYFAFHHTDADTFDKIDPEMMLQNTQIFAAMAWLLAEIPQRIPHAVPKIKQ